MADKKEILSRATSSFKGLSTGDAVGKQTETLSREDILKWYPEGVKGFHGRIGDVIPRYIDGSYKWRIGETTDDTEQTIAVAKAIIKEGRVFHSAVGQELLLCKKSNHPPLAIWRFQQHYFPNETAIIVPLAIAISLVTKSAEQTIFLTIFSIFLY